MAERTDGHEFAAAEIGDGVAIDENPGTNPGTQYLFWTFRESWLSAGFSWAQDAADYFL